MQKTHWRAAAPALLLLLVISLGWGGSVELQRERSSEAVMQALMSNNPAALQNTLNHGGNPNATNQFGETPPASVEDELERMLWLHTTVGWTTALTVAAETQNLPAVRRLLAHGANPNARNSDGAPPLTKLAQQPVMQYETSTGPDVAMEKKQMQEQTALVDLLCRGGADVNARSNDGVTPLIAAAWMHQPTIVSVLLDRGAAVNAMAKDRQTALSAAIMQAGDPSEPNITSTVKILLNHGANPNVKTPNGGSPLQQACEWIDKPIVLLLLQHGADPNVRSPANGMTPLIQAARQGQYEVAKLALAKGADPNILVEDDGTALFLAIVNHHRDLVKLLLNRGANPDLGYDEGFTPLMAAASQHDAQTISLLLAHGANVNQKDPHDDTALFYDAVSELADNYAQRYHVDDLSAMGHWRMAWPKGKQVPTAAAAVLLAHGADVNARDQWGNSALSVARASGKTALVHLLIAHGADG